MKTLHVAEVASAPLTRAPAGPAAANWVSSNSLNLHCRLAVGAHFPSEGLTSSQVKFIALHCTLRRLQHHERAGLPAQIAQDVARVRAPRAARTTGGAHPGGVGGAAAAAMKAGKMRPAYVYMARVLGSQILWSFNEARSPQINTACSHWQPQPPEQRAGLHRPG